MPWESRIQSKAARQVVVAIVLGVIFALALWAAWLQSQAARKSRTPSSSLNPPPSRSQLGFVYAPQFLQPQTSSVELSEKPILDRAWGIELHVPVGSKIIREPNSKYLMRIIDETNDCKIFLSVKRMHVPLEEAVVRMKTTTYAAGESVLVGGSYVRQFDERDLTVDRVPGALLYYDFPEMNSKDRLLLAQALIDVGYGLYVVFEMEAPLERLEPMQALFEAVLDSVSLHELWKLAEQRKRHAQRSDQWMETLTAEQIHESLIPNQWFRIVESKPNLRDKDVGWMEIRQERFEHVGTPGVRVGVQWRILSEDGKSAEDSLGDYFISDDRRFEQWLVTTTQRPAREMQRIGAAQPAAAPTQTSTEMGTRTGNIIDVKIDVTGQGPIRYSYPVPESGYLPRASAWLLPQLLPADAPATYGFYWFDTSRHELTFRSDRVIPALDRYEIETRTAPAATAIRSTYDASRKPIERAITPTLKLIPATPQELKTIWPDG